MLGKAGAAAPGSGRRQMGVCRVNWFRVLSHRSVGVHTGVAASPGGFLSFLCNLAWALMGPRDTPKWHYWICGEHLAKSLNMQQRHVWFCAKNNKFGLYGELCLTRVFQEPLKDTSSGLVRFY